LLVELKMQIRQDDWEQAEGVLEDIIPSVAGDWLEAFLECRRGSETDQCRLMLGVRRQEVAGADPEEVVVLWVNVFAQEVKPWAWGVRIMECVKNEESSLTMSTFLVGGATKRVSYTLNSFCYEVWRYWEGSEQL
jgi:hypothetical protein